MPELAEIVAYLQSLPPASVACAGPVSAQWLDRLTLAEAAAVESAVGKRRREFATGRALARQCAARLGFEHLELLPGAFRQPLWPAGLTGSISHTREVAICWAQRSAGNQFLGVDLERRAPLAEDLWCNTLTEQERADLPAEAPDQWAMVLFSAKESIYKAISGHVGRFVDFLEVSLTLRPADWRFDIRTHGPLGAELAHCQLHCGARLTRNFIATWCTAQR